MYSPVQLLEMRISHLAKIWGKTYIMGTREEADRDIKLLNCNLGVVELFQCGLGKHWDQLSLASDLLIAIQLH